MSVEPVWHERPLAALPSGAGARAPLVWHVRLDDPGAQSDVARARLTAEDLADLAARPQADMRCLRRRLVRALIATVAGTHPDAVSIRRTPAGAPVLLAPHGWYISVAGRWPTALIGVARIPIGVDIEPRDAPPPPPDAFTPGERATMERGEALRRWVSKEAHAKSLGVASLVAGEDIETRIKGDHIDNRCRYGASRSTLRVLGAHLAALAVAERPAHHSRPAAAGR